MIRVSEIQTALRGMVGFNQSSDPQYPDIDSSLTTSVSGRYIDATHPLCTIENIYNCAPEFSNFIFPLFSNTKTYAAKAKVLYNAKVYKALIIVAPAGGNPDVNTTGWKSIDPFSDWLSDLYDNASSGLITSLLQLKKATERNRTLLDKQFLYQGFGSITDKIIKLGRFVGITFRISQQDGLFVQLNKLGLQLDNTVDSLNIYLYHSSQDDPIATTVVNITKAKSFQWFELPVEFALYAKSILYDPNGLFFIGYYEDDLISAQAIHRSSDFTRSPCAGCDGSNTAAFNAWSKFVQAAAIDVPFTALSVYKKLFDNNFIHWNNITNFGLNIALSVYCDLTDVFVDNKLVYADVLAMKVCLDILQNIAFNTRINAVSDKVKAQAMSELDSNPTSGSFRVEYDKAMAGMNLDFSRLSKSCLPCVERKSITYGAV